MGRSRSRDRERGHHKGKKSRRDRSKSRSRSRSRSRLQKEIETGIQEETGGIEIANEEEGTKNEKVEEGIENDLRLLQKMKLEVVHLDLNHRIPVLQPNEKIHERVRLKIPPVLRE